MVVEPTIAGIADATENPAAASPRRALITGIGGQDGSYLTELLLEQGYEVHGVAKPGFDPSASHLAPVADQIELHETDLTAAGGVRALFEHTRPDEIYNFAAPSIVNASWDDPVATTDFMTKSVAALLQAAVDVVPEAGFVQAGSSEIFRGTTEVPQSEKTTPAPRSPYGAAKLFGHAMVGSYRERYGLHACSAILYNHESPRRPTSFLPRKVVSGAVAIKRGEADELLLGDLSARRDWGCAEDTVRAMWMMQQAEQPDDFVIATGNLHSVEELAQLAFAALDLDFRDYVKTDPRFVRSLDESVLVGDPTHAREALGWQPSRDFAGLIGYLVEGELAAATARS